MKRLNKVRSAPGLVQVVCHVCGARLVSHGGDRRYHPGGGGCKMQRIAKPRRWWLDRGGGLVGQLEQRPCEQAEVEG
jgi:hypothetical protein